MSNNCTLEWHSWEPLLLLSLLRVSCWLRGLKELLIARNGPCFQRFSGQILDGNMIIGVARLISRGHTLHEVRWEWLEPYGLTMFWDPNTPNLGPNIIVPDS